MIGVVINGGLGNQLFEVFALIAYSMRNKSRFYLINSNHDNTGKRVTYWKNLLYNCNKFMIQPYPEFLESVKKSHLYKEPNFSYNEIPVFDFHTTLFGFFQSYKYFDTEYERIIELLSLKEQQNKIKLLFPLDYENIISIHFRLGDYKNIQEFHPLLDLKFYINCIKFMTFKCKNKDLHFAYFCESQDNHIVNDHINQLKNMFPTCTFTKVPDHIPDWQQLLIMSNCKHNIIANSTFSWWAAYFNMNPQKVICYPSTWFGPALSNKNTEDLFPPSWIKLKSN